jgi:hypothetical protein
MEKEGIHNDKSICAIIYVENRAHIPEIQSFIPDAIKCSHYFQGAGYRQAIRERFFDGEIKSNVLFPLCPFSPSYPHKF